MSADGAGRALSVGWLASHLVAGLLGAVVISLFGDELALGVAIYAGNTEPTQPTLGYPWLVYCFFCAISLGGLYLATMQRGLLSTAALAVSHACAVCTVLLPFWQLWRLHQAI